MSSTTTKPRRLPSFAPIPEDDIQERLNTPEGPKVSQVTAVMSGQKPALKMVEPAQPLASVENAAAAEAAVVETTPAGIPEVVPAQDTQANPQPAQKVVPAQGSPSSTSTIREVPVEDIVLNRLNARKLPPTAAELDKLSQSMIKQQRTPAAAYIDKQGRVCLIDGHRRLAAAKNAGIPTLRVEFQPEPASDRELYLASRAFNAEREPQSVLDDAFSWRQMLDQGIYKSQADIARDMEMDEGDVSRILSLTTFPPRIIDLLNGQHRLLNTRMLGAIRLYFTECGEEATKALIISAEDEGLSSREVDKRRKAFNKDKVPRTRSNTKAQYAFANGNATVKQFEVARKLVLEIDSVAEGLPLDSLSEKLKAAMAAVLGEMRKGEQA